MSNNVSIKKRVGVGCRNEPEYAIPIKVLLNKFIASGKLPGVNPLILSPIPNEEPLKRAIRIFQITYVPITPDGVVDPKGCTLKYLNITPPERIRSGMISCSGETFERTEPIDIAVVAPPVVSREAVDVVGIISQGKHWKDKSGNWHHYKTINNYDEFIAHIEQKCGRHKYVRKLRIVGHGDRRSFAIGRNIVEERFIDYVGEYILSKIHHFFKKGSSIIYLDHCQVGSSHHFMKRISKAFGGVAIVAGSSNQSFNTGEPKLEGPTVVCSESRCISIPKATNPSLLSQAVDVPFSYWSQSELDHYYGFISTL